MCVFIVNIYYNLIHACPPEGEKTKIIVFSWWSRKDAILRLFVISLFRGEVKKTKRRNFPFFRYLVFWPRNNEKTTLIVISWRSRKEAILRLFVISTSPRNNEKTIICRLKDEIFRASFISLFRVVLLLFRSAKTKANRWRSLLFRSEITKWHKSATIWNSHANPLNIIWPRDTRRWLALNY